MEREPLVNIASLTALGAAVLALLTAFGLPLTDVQTQSVLGLIAVAAPLIVALLTRPKVDPSKFVAARRRGTRTYAGPAAQGTTKEGDLVDVLRAPEAP